MAAQEFLRKSTVYLGRSLVCGFIIAVDRSRHSASASRRVFAFDVRAVFLRFSEYSIL